MGGTLDGALAAAQLGAATQRNVVSGGAVMQAPSTCTECGGSFWDADAAPRLWCSVYCETVGAREAAIVAAARAEAALAAAQAERAEAVAAAGAAAAVAQVASAEVERLRILGPDTEARVIAEARALAAESLKPTVAAWRDAVAAARAEGEAAGAARERAAVVAWLRDHPAVADRRGGQQVGVGPNPAVARFVLREAIPDIEGGEHCRK